MLTYDLSKRGNLPIYVYLYQCIRDDIISGKLKKGEKLPSKRTLASHLSIGLITVANAYEQLVTEGYIESEEKRGFFVQDLSYPEEWNQKPPKAASDAGGQSLYKGHENIQNDEKSLDIEFFADFKANRTGLRHFPATRWNYYMREALSLQDDSLLRTIPYKGLFRLRQAIASYLQRTRGMNADPSQIIIGAGTEYLYSRLIQLFGRTCTFSSEDPGYGKFADISASYGNPWIYVPIDSKGLRVDLLEEYGADVVHVSPQNHFPTGLVMPVTRRAELFEWVYRVKKRYIIEDDYDSEFRYSGKWILPMFAEDIHNKIIYINTFSKTLVPSLRISYMVLPPALIERYEQTMSFYSCTVSSFEQYALARFIENGDLERHINRMKNYYKKQRTFILDAIRNSSLADISEIYENNAGTHFLLKVRTTMTEDEVRAAGRKNDMMLSLYSDYSHPAYTDAMAGDSKSWPAYEEANAPFFDISEEAGSSCVLVINYAGIDANKISEVINRLCNIFGKTDL